MMKTKSKSGLMSFEIHGFLFLFVINFLGGSGGGGLVRQDLKKRYLTDIKRHYGSC